MDGFGEVIKEVRKRWGVNGNAEDFLPEDKHLKDVVRFARRQIFTNIGRQILRRRIINEAIELDRWYWMKNDNAYLAFYTRHKNRYAIVLVKAGGIGVVGALIIDLGSRLIEEPDDSHPRFMEWAINADDCNASVHTYRGGRWFHYTKNICGGRLPEELICKLGLAAIPAQQS